ncbi:tRNA (adenosine(37)-N6)-threonylcarbamoyltransferase complex transferase subunit TsaD [Salirhabdus salicampi]|uniref:tRNA (adenosine(37)-N6)-threonylcarbamoyltransferase complex transferase subunit TsaD n=1 Tax=Salirhabdus salicampi TaxID=476102 RepID=UPI0020C48B6B|nr:tRNA (adenosine(37)-N6)-threonylcarbamoyltransferase complex transferase subunit TsaD [Salirhabdus salicampi]MCP8617824.1 tRNA (adenosine(37)-N6)-threonylcarbamoyltransferase complex transferase subunit TsaD [Salirhabdus salicampi]
MINDKNQYILAIETSCDETAVAIIKNGREMVTNQVASQVESHKRFGGVVPEIASRHHIEQITITLEEALMDAQLSMDDIDAVAVTEGPGLVGALLIGVNAAKAIAFAHQKPLIGIHHIAGHIYANRLIEEFQFPLLSLVVSGGHTELILMREHGNFEIIGETRDDAAGEAYDKVAKTLGLPYPGGPHIDRLAHEGEANIDFPRAWLEPDSFDFSFSGLKTAVLNTLHNGKQKGITYAQQDIAASFQDSVLDVLVSKTVKAARKHNVKQLLVAGGVAANKGLRNRLQNEFTNTDVQLVIPPLSLCTDNAAMIGAAASVAFEQGHYAGWELNANPSLSLEKYAKRSK